MVKIMALGTFVSCSLVIFFSPSNKRNDSKVGGAFMVAKNRRKKRLNDEKSTALPKFQEVLNNNKNKQSDLTVGTKTAQSI